MRHVSFYVSGHGLGHATRVLAVVRRLLEEPGWTAEIRTSAPRWCFERVIGSRCRFEMIDLEPGVVQSDSFHHDLDATCDSWRAHLRALPSRAKAEAHALRRGDAEIVLSDVSPLGCAAAAAASLPWLDNHMSPWKRAEPFR